MYDYKLKFYSENKNIAQIPSELTCPESIEKFGDKIRLVWSLYVLKDENVWERIQEDENNGIIYSEINTENLSNLTAYIDFKFLQNLLNNDVYFKLPEIAPGSKYSLTFSLESDKKVLGARGCKWSQVNVIAFERKEHKWIYDEDYFWNHHKWTVLDYKKGNLEITNAASY